MNRLGLIAIWLTVCGIASHPQSTSRVPSSTTFPPPLSAAIEKIDAMTGPELAKDGITAPQTGKSQSESEVMVLHLYKEAAKALVEGNIEAISKLWADDFVGIGPTGRLRTKVELIEGYRQRLLKLESSEAIETPQIRMYNDDSALVMIHARSKGESSDRDTSGEYRGLWVWAKKNGNWQIVSYQSALIPKQGDPDEAAIRKIIADGTDAWNRRDAKALTTHTREDCDHINVNGVWRNGRAETEKALSAALATTRNNMTSFVAKIRFVTPDVAIAVIRRDYTSGEETRKSISISVFHKINGIWWNEAFQNTYVVPPESRAEVVAHTASEAPPQSDSEAKIRRLENEWVQLAVHNDGAGYGPLLADEFIVIRTDGVVKTKADRVKAFSSGSIQTEVLELSDMQVRTYGNVAVVTGLATRKDTIDGKARDFQYRYTRVWILRDDRWQCALMQSTTMGPLDGLSK